MRCAEVKALHTISAVSGLNPISAVSRPWRIALNLYDAPQTRLYSPLTRYVQNEIEARLSIGFSAKGSIVSLVESWSKRKWLCSSTQLVVLSIEGLYIEEHDQLIQKKRYSSGWIWSYFTFQLARMSNQMLQGQRHMLLKYMVTYKVSTWKYK